VTWIQTASGVAFDSLDPQPDMVKIEDIAHSLSLLCRFTGHVSEFYSVAQHCCLVSDQMPSHLRLAGLLHDAAEAYVGDVSRPLKDAMAEEGDEWRGPYRRISERVDAAIAARFGVAVEDFHCAQVKEADVRMLMAEKRDLMPGGGRKWDAEWVKGWGPYPTPIQPWQPHWAKNLYLSRFRWSPRGGG
jgi:hypothetical protein